MRALLTSAKIPAYFRSDGGGKNANKPDSGDAFYRKEEHAPAETAIDGEPLRREAQGLVDDGVVSERGSAEHLDSFVASLSEI